MVRVIGAGLSGLAAAWCLTETGAEVEVIEAASRQGGLIETIHAPEGLVERAANGFVWNETTARWFRDLEITPCRANDASRRRFIFRNGRARRWPLGIRETARLARRAGWARLTGAFQPRDQETVADWSTRVGGPAMTTWLVAPALQGIYAAPADRLSARAVLAGRFRKGGAAGHRRSGSRRITLVAPGGGMGEFIDRLYDRLRARHVTFSFGRRGTLDPSVRTIIATDAPGAAALLAPYAPRSAEVIGRISMTSLVSATAFFAPDADDLRGFGVLFPREAGVRALGVLFNTEIFAGRGRTRSETWIYGSLAGQQALPSPSDLPSWIQDDRMRLTGRRDRPMALGHSVDRPPSLLPVYDSAVLSVEDRLADLPPWLALAGNYLGRLGVSKLLDVARGAAERVMAGSR